MGGIIIVCIVFVVTTLFYSRLLWHSRGINACSSVSPQPQEGGTDGQGLWHICPFCKSKQYYQNQETVDSFYKNIEPREVNVREFKKTVAYDFTNSNGTENLLPNLTKGVIDGKRIY